MLRTIVKLATVLLVPAAFSLGFSCSNGGAGVTCVSATCKGGVVSVITGGDAACSTCIETKCSAQASAFCGACAAEIACEEACACTDTACISACDSNLSAACLGAGSAGSACQIANCAGPCSTAGSSSSSSSGTGSSSSGSTGGNCAALLTCCGSLPAGSEPACDQIALAGVDQDCASALSGYVANMQCSE